MKKLYPFCVILGVTLLALAARSIPPEKDVTGGTTTISSSIDKATWIDANKILMFVSNTGIFGYDAATTLGSSIGTYYPYQSVEQITGGELDDGVLYAAGLWLAGRVDSETRVAIAEYSSEYVPGPMADSGYLDDSPDFRVYKLCGPDCPVMDYCSWPEDQGADVDDFGRPVRIGDQTLWAVFNDADPVAHSNSSGSTEPLGIEVQQTVWAADQTGADSIIIAGEIEVSQSGFTQTEVRVETVEAAEVTGDDYWVEIEIHETLGPIWRLINVTTGTTLLDNQTNFSGDSNYPVVEGIRVTVICPPADFSYSSADPLNYSPVAEADNGYTGGVRWFTGGNHGGDLLYGGIFLEPNFWTWGTTVAPQDMKEVAIIFRPMVSYTDLNGDGEYSIGEPYAVDDPAETQGAFVYQGINGATFDGFYNVPFTAWDITDPVNHRQLNVVLRDYDLNQQWDLHFQADPADPLLPNNGDTRYNFFWILDTDYDPTGTMYGDGTSGTIDFFGGTGGPVQDGMWVVWLDERSDLGMLAEECTLSLNPGTVEEDTFTFTATAPPIFTTGHEGVSIYMRYKLYNRGDNQIEDCYFGIWADPDLGDYGDDLVGCDTLSDIFYCYNGGATDVDYGSRPPAIGFKVIHGPLVPSPGQTALFDGETVADFANLGLTAFRGLSGSEDPDEYNGVYNCMQGLYEDGSPLANGTVYDFPGDPPTATGDLDEYEGDRRMLGSCGPFDLNPGDSQYVLIKLAVGQGADNLQSVDKLREILNSPSSIGTDSYDVECPSLASFAPARNQVGVTASENISLTFAGTTDETIIQGMFFTVYGSVSGLHEGNLSYDDIAGSITFDPYDDFAPGEVVTARVASAWFDVSTWSFTIDVSGPAGTFMRYLDLDVVGAAPWAVAVADLDNDGDIDLTTANCNSNDQNIVYNLGGGSFGAVNLSLPETLLGPRAACVGDLDGDGLVDVGNVKVDLGYYHDSLVQHCAEAITTSLNEGFGEPFASYTIHDYNFELSPSYDVYSMVAADLDDDGDLDLLRGNVTLHQTSIIWNRGYHPWYWDLSDYSAGVRPRGVCAADFNNDGLLDIAAANAGSDNLSIRLNEGGRSFASPAYYTTGDAPYSVCAADFDLDGHLDLAVANDSSHSISILINNGDATFAPQVTYAVEGVEPHSIVAADWDADQDIDIATANYGSDDVSVFRNDGGGVMILDSVFEVGSEPTSIAAADFNGDGHIDLVTSNSGSDNLTFLMSVGITSCCLNRGDFNHDGQVDVADIVAFAQWAFHGDPNEPGCVEDGDYYPECDLNGDGRVDVADITFFAAWSFHGGEEPVPCE
ncbi:MAG: VCBS repeat-containing protein [candidate division Zixibacteria bacterium]|nr:VCBS repeat-containing protein [candidate division Zixibacteria bacterium]